MSNLSKEFKENLKQLSTLVTQFYETPEPAKIGVIRQLARDRETICAIYVEQDTKRKSTGIDVYTKEEMLMISEIDDRIMRILTPIFDKLIKSCINDFNKWMKEVNCLSPYMYQLQTVHQLIKIVITRSRPDIIYTLLISRGGGKSFSLSGFSSFFQTHWDKYILHNKNQDYGIAISTYVDKQLDEFRKNVKGNLANHFNYYKGNTNLKIILNNPDEIVIYKNGRPYSKCMFRIATSSMESVHADLLLADEAKFYPRSNLLTSVIPCVGGRTGIKILISSAHEYYSEFQGIVERNIRDYKKDGIVRHIEFHWEKMTKYNPSYLMTVMSALSAVDGNRNDPNFATQYDNKFLSKGGSSFFNMQYMKDIGSALEYNPLIYMNDNYTIVGGWDIAVTGDNSLLTFKAIPNGVGENRKSFLIAQILMNQSKSEAVDITPKQVPRIVELMALYNCKAIVVDCTGLGNGADILLKEEVRRSLDSFKQGFDESNIIGFKYGEKNKVDLLDFYLNRLKGGMEVLPLVHDFTQIDADDSYSEAVYKQMYNLGGDELYPQMVRFYVEHKHFNKKVEFNEYTKATKTIYVQANYKWLHDDTIMSSAKASWCLRLFPHLTNFYSNDDIYADYGDGGNYVYCDD